MMRAWCPARVAVLLGVVGLWAVAPSGAPAAGLSTITALGNSSVNGAVAVNAAHQVLLFNGSVWENGSVIVPKAPASDPTAKFTAESFGNSASLSSSGIAVGEATTGSGTTVPAYWNTAQATFTEVSLSGLTVDGQPAVGGYLVGVDAAGEAVGMVGNAAGWPASYNPSADDAGLFIPASGGQPAGQPSVVSSIGGTKIYSLDGISASYEAANEADDDVNPEVLVDRQSQTATTTNLMPTEGGPIGFADNGSMTGFAGSAETLRSAGGGETALVSPPGEEGPVTDVNDAGVSLGSLVNTTAGNAFVGVSWNAAGTATDLLSQVSNPAGWSGLVPAAIDDQGDIVGRGLYNGIQQEAFLIATTLPTVSGTVSNESCTSSGCVPSGLAGVSVALSGTASDGTKVTQITSSAADGTWSVSVPPGTYTATVNGDGTGFTPETVPVNVAAGGVSGVNFATCNGTADGVLSAADGLAEERAALDGHAATSGPTCEATYTLHIDATIPQKTFLDPAGGSAYPRRLDGKDFPFDNAGTIALSYLHVNAFNKYVGSYPVCMPETLKEQSWRKHIVVHWQTTYRGAGVNLGEITVPLDWNRHTRTVSVVGKATAEEGHLVRIYKYEMAGTERTCTAKGTVEPEFDVEPTGNTFKVTASWDFPFPAKDGKNVVENSKVFSPAVEKILGKIPGYEKLPKAVKAPIEYIADKAAEFGASKVGLEALVERLEPLSPLQLAATIDGYFGDYSTMDMAVNGQFTTLQRADVLTLGRRTNYITQLSMHVASDDFPDYHLEVTRNDVALPWVHTTTLGNDLVLVNANTFSDRGFKDGMVTDSDRGPLAADRLVGGYGAWRTIDAALNIVKNFFGRSLGGGGTPNCSGADAICYRMLDGHP